MVDEKEKKQIFNEEEWKKTLNDFQEDFGEGSVTLLSQDRFKSNKEALSSGSILLDNIMWRADRGGYVRGKIFEISGLQSSGKSTLAFHAVRESQKLGEKVIYFDLENGIDIEYIKGIGVDINQLIISYPRSGEEAFEMIARFVELDVGLIVVDSVSNLVPRSQLDSNLEKTRIGSHAALMSSGLRKIKNKLINKRTIIIFINQLRNNINTGFFFSSQEVTTGGMALQYESDLRIKLRFREKIEKNDKTIIGIKIEAKITKNRFFKPYGVTELEMFFPFGIKRSREIVRLAVEKKIIRKNVNWYYYEEKKLGNGLEATVDFLETEKDLLSFIENKVIKKV